MTKFFADVVAALQEATTRAGADVFGFERVVG